MQVDSNRQSLQHQDSEHNSASVMITSNIFVICAFQFLFKIIVLLIVKCTRLRGSRSRSGPNRMLQIISTLFLLLICYPFLTNVHKMQKCEAVSIKLLCGFVRQQQ